MVGVSEANLKPVAVGDEIVPHNTKSDANRHDASEKPAHILSMTARNRIALSVQS